MKAGTAQKMVLNMLSTGAMTRLGYVYSNLMINVLPKNTKLRERAIGILQHLTGTDRAMAQKNLKSADNDLPVALVMVQSGVSRPEASRFLKTAGGHVRKAIALAAKGKHKK